MALQLVVFAAVIGISTAAIIPTAHLQASPLVRAVVVNTEYDSNPQYSYAYDVQDALTGDSKRQHESRNGDVVHGSYSLNEPDGTRRTVDYAADPVHGFNAVVRREPLARVALAAPVAIASQATQLLPSSLAVVGAHGFTSPAVSASSSSVTRVDTPRLATATLAPVALAVNQLQSPFGVAQLSGINALALSTNLGLAGPQLSLSPALQAYPTPAFFQASSWV